MNDMDNVDDVDDVDDMDDMDDMDGNYEWYGCDLTIFNRLTITYCI
jgi:hypothetical protein